MTPQPSKHQPKPVFVDNSVAAQRPDQYVELTVDARKVLADWKSSLLAHELLDSNGMVKGDDHLSESRLEKRDAVRSRLAAQQPLEKPILGIGIFDNIEIGSGSDILATLVMEGVTHLPVHIRKAQARDFDPFKV
ncbi:MAG: hypothetical protein KGQ41_00280 [Alphaproteobacteria bacterium]|nr:hypothetical protein [Alphaproteobacteria bacterium]